MASCCEADGCHAAAPDPAYRRVLQIALVLNGGMFLAEIVVAWLADSVSVQADALDFLGDTANFAVSLFVLGMSARWRRNAALGKAVVMGIFGLGVAGNTLWHLLGGSLPRSELMSGIGTVALIVNVGVAFLLARHGTGDSNRLSVWLCTRNDAIANLAVILAGFGVWLSGTNWPDLAVASVIAGLGISGSLRILRRVRTEHGAGILASSA